MAVSYEELSKLLKLKQPAALKRLMKSRGIRWSLDSQGRPWTTESELDRAISAPRKTITFTKPICRKKTYRSLTASMRNMDRGTSSKTTNGGSYAE